MSRATGSFQLRRSAPAKLVYFATGSLSEVATDFERLRRRHRRARLCVVAPAAIAGELGQFAPLQRQKVFCYRPLAAFLLWLRLLLFLGFSRKAMVVCLSGRQRFPFLKLLAMSLRGRVVFSPAHGQGAPLGPVDIAGIWVRRALDVREEGRKNLPIGVVGSASGFYLQKIVARLRARYPHAPMHALLPPAAASAAPLFDSVRACPPGMAGLAWGLLRLRSARTGYQRWIVPCTNEPYTALKLLALLWPLPRRQIYNELGDGFPVRRLGTLWRHLHWRLRDRLSYQIVAGTSGRSAPLRLLHLLCYGLRLCSAIPLLVLARLRALRSASQGPRRAMPRSVTMRGEEAHDERMEAVRLDLPRRHAAVGDASGQSGGAGGSR